MGLDITAYQQLTEDKDGNITLWINDDFPGRADPFDDPRLCFTAAKTYYFAAGSYGGYNEWRDQLAKLAGYPSINHPSPHRKGESSHAAYVWKHHPTGQFSELIDFADNEGILGTKVCQKLLQDFKTFEDKAKQQDEYFWSKYQEWMKAMELAADNGAVAFH